MPWINKEMCTGCELCVQVCPVKAIALGDDNLAFIDDNLCIRCGKCHDACAQQAVRHDSERIPQDVAANLQWVRRLLDHFETTSERAAFIGRIKRYFNKEKKVIEKTLAVLKTLDGDTTQRLDAAIRSALEPQDQQAN
jgi:ferredoxin